MIFFLLSSPYFYYFATIPQVLFRTFFCEQSSQKARKLQREIMQSVLLVTERTVTHCEGTEQLHYLSA